MSNTYGWHMIDSDLPSDEWLFKRCNIYVPSQGFSGNYVVACYSIVDQWIEIIR
jgi:hypothetical protein